MPEIPRCSEEEPPSSSVNTSKVSVVYMPGFERSFSFLMLQQLLSKELLLHLCSSLNYFFFFLKLFISLFIHGVVSVALWQLTVETVTLRRE